MSKCGGEGWVDVLKPCDVNDMTTSDIWPLTAVPSALCELHACVMMEVPDVRIDGAKCQERGFRFLLFFLRTFVSVTSACLRLSFDVTAPHA